MTFYIFTIFPEIFNSYFSESIIKRAQERKKIKIKIYNLRDWASDKHKTVDDAPYGGGAGMVMKVDVIYRAIMSLRAVAKQSRAKEKNGIAALPLRIRFGGVARNDSKIILLSAKGKKWNQQMAKKYSKLDNIILICGRYEGVDERVKKFVDEEISLGDYVLTGGEIGAMAIVDSVTRLLPGVLGNTESLKYESHSQPGLLEYPQYTRPKKFITGREIFVVPKILLSGDHKKIEEWRKKKMKQK